MEQLRDATKTWESPLDGKEMYTNLQAVLGEWASAKRGLENMRDRVHQIQNDNKGEKAKEKKTWHEQKNKVIAHIYIKNNGHLRCSLAHLRGAHLLYQLSSSSFWDQTRLVRGA